jgi:hypothetical protein
VEELWILCGGHAWAVETLSRGRLELSKAGRVAVDALWIVQSNNLLPGLWIGCRFRVNPSGRLGGNAAEILRRAWAPAVEKPPAAADVVCTFFGTIEKLTTFAHQK